MGLKESGQGFTSFPEGNGKLWVKQVCCAKHACDVMITLVVRERSSHVSSLALPCLSCVVSCFVSIFVSCVFSRFPPRAEHTNTHTHIYLFVRAPSLSHETNKQSFGDEVAESTMETIGTKKNKKKLPLYQSNPSLMFVCLSFAAYVLGVFFRFFFLPCPVWVSCLGLVSSRLCSFVLLSQHL